MNNQASISPCLGEFYFSFLQLHSAKVFQGLTVVKLCKTRKILISGKGQNGNFDYKIVISVKNPKFIL